MINNADLRKDYIQTLEEFKNLLYSYRHTRSSEVRTAINRKSRHVQRLVIAAHAAKTITIAPPPAIGGMIMRDINPFDMLFKEFYGLDIIEQVIDSVDEAIGNIERDLTFSLEDPIKNQGIGAKQPPNKMTNSKTLTYKEKILGMPQEAFWPLVLAIISGAFFIGLRFGQEKFDKEKIDLYNSNQNYKSENYNLLKQLGVEQSNERRLQDSITNLRMKLTINNHLK